MKNWLTWILNDPGREARWLNTLSLLEHIGARKIAKTVAHAHPSLEVLEHLSDETRHAAAFKRLSRIVDSGCDDYLSSEEAVGYFQSLDQEITKWVTRVTGHEDTSRNYLFVTCIIERRAMRLYPLYRSLTSQASVKEELTQVITEEAAHRQDIEGQIAGILSATGVQSLQELEQIEDKLFEVWTSKILL